MLSAAAARRTSGAVIRNPTTLSSSRTIAFSTHSRPLQRLPRPDASIPFYKIRPLPPLSLRHVFNPSHQTRSLSYLQRTRLGLRQASKGIWRKNPVLLPLAIVSVVGASLFFAYIVYIELTQNAPQYHKYPPNTARHLRKAVYYTDVVFQPKLALQSYNAALKSAIEEGMHPFSDEVLGINLQAAKLLEQAGAAMQAVKLLETTKEMILKTVETGRKEAAERKEAEEKHAKKQVQPKAEYPGQYKLEVDNPQILEEYERIKELDEYNERQRNKAMKKAVGISLKLAELYGSDHIQDSKKAEAAQEAAVELSLKELQYRQSLGLPVNGGAGDDGGDKIDWLTRTEVVIALAGLAETYFSTEKAELAVPLFLRALELLRAEEGPNPTCRQVMLIGDVAAALGGRAQQPFRVENPEAARQETVNNARQWAMKSLEMNKSIPDDEKDGGCFVSCVQVKYSLGEFAELQGNLKVAEKWYRQALGDADQFFSKDEPEVTEFLHNLKAALDRVSKK
ncbi:hypothetical protein BDW62DRAFT_188902 [Aspergillus aurantiobrunneus]